MQTAQVAPKLEIRAAVEADVDALLSLGEDFLRHSGYGELIKPTEDDVRGGFLGLIDRGVVFIAERAGRIVGVLGGLMSAVWFSPDVPVGAEMLWWVAPEARGGLASVRLVRAFEQWAVERGARLVTLSDIVLDDSTRVTQLIATMGYRLAERSHMKVIPCQ